MNSTTLYLKISQNTVVNHPHVCLGQVGKMECADRKTAEDIGAMEIFRFDVQKKRTRRIQTFSVLKIIEMIHRKDPGLNIVNLGAADFVVRYIPSEDPQMFQLLKTVLICVALFFGAAFMIMTFNTDVAVSELFDRLYYEITGKMANGVTALEIGYCIGLPAGILVFYNHIGKKKLTDDPTPVQVSMRKYEQDVDAVLIEEKEREGKSEDVD